MKRIGPVFEEPWPDNETRLVLDAVRSAVPGPPEATSGARSTASTTATNTATNGATTNSLAEAGRRWARAHQSASLMRSRLSALEASMATELGTASEADRAAYYRAWRTVTDAATWMSLTQLEEAALVDPLTGVGNRRALDLMLTRAMAGARRAGSALMVVAVDLDGLKRINDSQGHAAGDRTLTSLVGAFGEGLRAYDTVFRTGGDEFAIVLPGMGAGDIGPLMHRISAGGAPGFTWGAAALTDEHQLPAELLDAADTDLYRRRGVEREVASVGAGVGAGAGIGAGVAAAGGTLLSLRHANRSIRTRVSGRARVAAAAVLVAIAATLGAVSPLSTANHGALPLKPPGRPSGSSTAPVATTPTTVPPASTPPVTPTTAPTTPTTTPITSGASAPNIQLAAVTSPSPGAGSVGATTISPPASPVPSAAPPKAAPAAPAAPGPAPAATVPVATAPSAHKPLPSTAAAAAIAAHAKH